MERLAERVLPATMSNISIITHGHICISVVPRPVCRRIPWRFLAHEVDYSQDYYNHKEDADYGRQHYECQLELFLYGASRKADPPIVEVKDCIVVAHERVAEDPEVVTLELE